MLHKEDIFLTLSGDSLKQKSKRGVIWCTIERFATNGIQFVLTIVLARLLNPEDYGIIAMPAIFLAIAQVFIDSGIANALIRKPDLNEKDLSTAFYFNIIVGVICYWLLFSTSSLIADFFNTPILSHLLKVSALVVLINSLGIVQQAVLTKHLNFKIQAYITIISTIISGFIGIWMAYSGCGVWSLVVQQVSLASFRVILLWIYGKWKPKRIFSKKSFHYLWTFGNKVVIVGVLDAIYNNVYAFVIGKLYKAKDLGNYTRAQQFAEFPVNNLNSVVQRVSFPLLSEIQQDNERLSSIFLRLFEMVSLIIFPLMFLIAAMAKTIILFLLGEEWEGCIIMLQILCLTRLWVPLNALNLNLLQVKGRTDLLLNVEIAKKIVITIVLFLTIIHGVIILLLGFAFCGVVAFAINSFYTKRIIGVGYIRQLQVLFPSLIISTIIIVAILAFNQIPSNLLVQFILDLLIGGFLYFTYIALFRKEFLHEVISIIKK